MWTSLRNSLTLSTMSFLAGSLSGALVAGGIYYAIFSRDLQSRTMRHQRDIHCLVNNLQEPQVPAPSPAVARINYDPRKALLKQRWNEEIEGLFNTVRGWDNRIIEWGRRLVGDDRTQ